MKPGLLWFDDDPSADLSLKIDRAIKFTQLKYGCKPRVCFVHPSMIKKNIKSSQGIEINASRLVLPNHIWLEFCL